MKTFSVKIPSGIRDGEKVRLLGQGKQGQNGGKNGDMFIKINIQNNDKFRLQGYDIVTDLYLTPWEAALGKRVNIDSIEDPISIYVPPGIQSGEKVKIPQKGYKDGRGSRGDLIAEVKTVVPKKLTEEEKRKILSINITNLDEIQKNKLRGALKFFTGDFNNMQVEIINEDKKSPAGGLLVTDKILAELQEIVGKENARIEEG